MLSLLLLTTVGCSDDDDDGTAPPVDTDAPADVASFLALPGDGHVVLTWTNPADPDLAGVLIRRAVGIDPTPTTGEPIFEGLATEFTDTDVDNDTTYHYTAFAFDQEGNHADGVSDSCMPREAIVVAIADPQLEQLLRSELGVPSGDITDLDLVRLTALDASDQGIADLQGLEHAVNLGTLDLSGNDLTTDGNLIVFSTLTSLVSLDLSDNPLGSLDPLVGITSLESLSFGLCPVSDLTPLATLVNLRRLSFPEAEVTSLEPLSDLVDLNHLEADDNEITDVAPLAPLVGLTNLSLNGNRIRDISPLDGLMALEWFLANDNLITDIEVLIGLPALRTVGLLNNPLAADAVTDDLPVLVADGVNVDFDHDAALLDLMGAWLIDTVTVGALGVDPAEHFEWDAGTVAMRLTVFPFGAYMIEELDAADVPVSVETGVLEVDGANLTMIVLTEDGVSVDPPQEWLSGTWDTSGIDLMFSTEQDDVMVTMTWRPELD
jgi:hypothetical protein